MLNVIKWFFEMLNAKIFRMLDVNALTTIYSQIITKFFYPFTSL